MIRFVTFFFSKCLAQEREDGWRDGLLYVCECIGIATDAYNVYM